MDEYIHYSKYDRKKSKLDVSRDNQFALFSKTF